MTDFLDLTVFRAPDCLPVRETTPQVLDMDNVTKHIKAAQQHGQYRGPLDPITYLLEQRFLVAVDDTIYATMAGILCFGTNPQAFFPRAVVDIGHYRSMETLAYDVIHLEKDIGGTLFDQLARVEHYLWVNTHHGMTIQEGSLQRQSIHEYPQPAIRELIVNMLAHRDYTNFQSAARVQVFRNRIEWISPGGLPPGITVENILTSQASRNPLVLWALYVQGYGEAVGKGMDTVVKVLKADGLPPPRFEDTGAAFIVTVQGRPPEAFGGDEGYIQLNDRQRTILNALRMRGELTATDIQGLFDQTTTVRTLQRDINELLRSRLLSRTGKGRSVRYHIGT